MSTPLVNIGQPTLYTYFKLSIYVFCGMYVTRGANLFFIYNCFYLVVGWF